jgi:hypothetical protein
MSGVKIKPDEQFARLLELSSPLAAGADSTMLPMANLRTRRGAGGS